MYNLFFVYTYHNFVYTIQKWHDIITIDNLCKRCLHFNKEVFPKNLLDNYCIDILLQIIYEK